MRIELNSGSTEQLLEVANAHFSGWPYTRRLDKNLVNSWDSAYGYADCCFLLAQGNNKPVAFLHGELRQDVAIVHLLAVADGERQAAVDLLAEFESLAKERAIGRLIGPHGPTISYYGGYVLGYNPYHPHWAMVATDAYLLAGCEVTGAGCILTMPLEARGPDFGLPKGYEMRTESVEEERATSTYKFSVVHDDRVVGYSFASYCAELPALEGGSIGHVKYVETDPEHRNKGLGRAMVSASLKAFQRHGASEAILVTSFDNAAALRTYEHVGFRRRHLILGVSKQLSGLSNKFL
jgi:ribosomal protein S18 acetylase RimI-like enzyme